MPVLQLVPRRTFSRGWLAVAGVAGLAVYAAALVLITGGAPSNAAPRLAAGALPPITILPSRGVQSQLNLATAQQITHNLVAVVPAHANDPVRLWLEPGKGQSPPVAVAQLAGVTYRLHQAAGAWALGQSSTTHATAPLEATGSQVPRYRLTNIASQVGLDFQQGSFRFGMSNDYRAMMGGGVCWLDYNGDGWLDLFAVNSYSSADTDSWDAQGGLPRTALFEN